MAIVGNGFGFGGRPPRGFKFAKDQSRIHLDIDRDVANAKVARALARARKIRGRKLKSQERVDIAGDLGIGAVPRPVIVPETQRFRKRPPRKQRPRPPRARGGRKPKSAAQKARLSARDDKGQFKKC